MQKSPRKAACLGECMIELAPQMDALYRLSFAGDTFNTAVYMKRQLGDHLRVEFLTALGNDNLSRQLCEHARSEGIGTDHVRVIDGGQAGLYLIENDDAGERSFHYWRSRSAARNMLSGRSVQEAADWLAGFDLVYLSGISLAILDPLQQETLLSALEQLPRNTLVAFDPNFREALWPRREDFCALLERVGSRCDIILTTRADEDSLFAAATIADCIDRWQDWGCGEIVIKDGANGCHISTGGQIRQIAPSNPLSPVDTTGAGDSFSGGYLAARLMGKTPEQAAVVGNEVAAQVIQYPGAIVPKYMWLPVEEGISI